MAKRFIDEAVSLKAGRVGATNKAVDEFSQFLRGRFLLVEHFKRKHIDNAPACSRNCSPLVVEIFRSVEKRATQYLVPSIGFQ